MPIADNPCALCRGEAATSTAQCQCPASTRCINCGVLTTSSLCTRCEALPRCQTCKRHLPRWCFLQFDGDNASGGGVSCLRQKAAQIYRPQVDRQRRDGNRNSKNRCRTQIIRKLSANKRRTNQSACGRTSSATQVCQAKFCQLPLFSERTRLAVGYS